MRIPFARFALAALLSGACLAQDTSGGFTGRIVDASGAAVPGAEITATHNATGAVRKTTSGAEGTYALPDMAIGTYDISATHPGFKKAVRRGLELHVSDRMGVDIVLEVGEITQEVSVTANAQQVQTESSDQGGLISGEQVRDLQLNGRTFITLLELLPGVVSDMPDRTDPIATSMDLSVNGARTSAGGFGVDGGSNPSIVGSTALNTKTSIDSIAEFTVLTSTFSAEYGRGGISQVNVVTKTGTRRFHGSAYEFFRNDALDARDYFSHRVLPLKLNNFGYSLGGPVILPRYNRERNKTFFFVLQEWSLVSTRGAAVNTTVPGVAERAGDFSALAATAVVDPATGASFPGGVIPASRINANGRKLLSLYPAPNFKGPGAINFTSAAPSWQNYRQDLVRIDHNFSSGWKLFVRYIHTPSSLRNPYGGQTSAAASSRIPGINESITGRAGHNVIVNLSATIRPTLLNQFSFNYSYTHLGQKPASAQASRPALGIRIPELFPENEGGLIPAVNPGSGYAALVVSRPGLTNLMLKDVSDNLTKILGRHVIKIGGLYYFGGDQESNVAATNGSFSFNTGYSKNPIANLLLGLPYSYTEAETTVFNDTRYSMAEAFVQDDFKATPRLTLNLGLRYSAYFSPYDVNNMMSNFIPWRYDPARAPRMNPSTGQPVAGTGDRLNGIVLAGKTSPYGRLITPSAANLFGPRMGFAYAPFRSKRTAIRGGYGIYYTRPIVGNYVNCTFSNPPWARSVTILQPQSMDNPGAGVQAADSAPSLVAIGIPTRMPTVQQWSLGVQQEVFRNAILNVSYVGSHGTHLVRPVNINDPEPGAAAAARVNVNAVRPFQGYGAINRRESTGNSIYHSLQVSFNRRMARGLSAGMAYTWGKTIDIGSSDRGAGDLPPNNRNVRAERGPSDSDRAHVFTANFIWNLPGPARRGLLRHAFNGWQISGITRLWSGRPFDVTMSSDVAGIGATENQRPDIIAATSGPRTVEQWFNRDAFARPASYTFGNMGRNSLRGPGVNKWDLSLFKNFAAGSRERVRMQFRAEAFNAFNHPSFTTLGTSLNTTSARVNPLVNSFAVITNTRDARVLQFALKTTF